MRAIRWIAWRRRSALRPHTRAPGSFDQASAGITIARARGARVLCAFPLEVAGHSPGAVALARSLTGHDPIHLPEPEIEAHGGDFLFDVMALRDPGHAPAW